MDIVVDANVLFAALIKEDSFAYSLLLVINFIYSRQNTFSQNWKSIKKKFLRKQTAQWKNFSDFLKYSREE